MPAAVLDGEVLATEIKEELGHRIERLTESGITPGLGTVLVGDDGPSANYVAMKHRDCAALGMVSTGEHLPADATQAQVMAVVDRFNADPSIDAYLLQYPFPAHLDFLAAQLAVDPAKDADGLHPVNLGKLVMGEPGPRPCTPVGIQRLLERYQVETKGKHIVIVGRGLTIGRPLVNLLSLKENWANAAVTVVHTGVDDIGAHTRQADIVVAAAGSPGLLTADMVKPGAAVIGAGVTYEGKTVLSDVADDVADVAGFLTPRLGGVGPMTRAMLYWNTVSAAEAAL